MEQDSADHNHQLVDLDHCSLHADWDCMETRGNLHDLLGCLLYLHEEDHHPAAAAVGADAPEHIRTEDSSREEDPEVVVEEESCTGLQPCRKIVLVMTFRTVLDAMNTSLVNVSSKERRSQYGWKKRDAID